MPRHVPQYFQKSHHPELVIPMNQLDPLLSEPWAADGRKL